jgi:hypothetical protein
MKDGQDGALMCSSHQKPITLDPGTWIRHKDGGYCNSEQFTAGTLTRAQAMGLLILTRGQEILNGR